METLEQLETRHQKQLRDLQSRITSKKKNATKKTRKGINTECDELERQLRDTQELEFQELNGSVPEVEDIFESASGSATLGIAQCAISEPKEALGGLADDLQNISLADKSKSDDGQPRRRNRQQARLARRAAEQEATSIEAEKQAAELPNWKRQERTAMLKTFKENGLIEKEIVPDGHCMFSAIADQLSEVGIAIQNGGERAPDARERYRTVRKVAARYIEGHPDDFSGFLDEPLGVYANKIRDTAEWGGQVELIALSKSYNVEICVIQDGRVDRFQPGLNTSTEADKIWLAYYRHGYGLGEHYNSLRKAP